MADELPLLALIETGGTIANTDHGRISVDELLLEIAVAHPAEDPRMWATIETRGVTRRGAGEFTPTDWLAFARTASTAASEHGLDGLIITHGTFTAEETAYFLHLTVKTTKPIIVVCAQRKHGSLGADGDRNLLDAVRVATSPDAAGKGVLLVMHEEVHSARDVTKTNQRPGGFVSPGMGPLGSIEADQVSFYRNPTRRHTQGSEFELPQELPRVDIVPTYPGADGVAVDAAVEAGSVGIVVDGFAYNGRPHLGQLEALDRAAANGVRVVLSTRGRGGRIPVEPQNDLKPFVRADNLAAHKARVLLMLALTKTNDQMELQRIFSEY